MVDTNSQCEDSDQCGRAIVETIVNHHSVDLTDEEGRQMYVIQILPENYQETC